MKADSIVSVIGPPGLDQRSLATKVMKEILIKANLSLNELTFIVATGYGRINVTFADKQITEISCHARGVTYFFPEAKTAIDIGGQDCKAIKLRNGRPGDFVMNDKCAAGTGRFIEVTAEGLDVPLEDLGELSLKSTHPARISNICTVYAAQEVVERLAEGDSKADIIAGIHEATANRVCGMVGRLNIEKEVVVTGGGAKNIGLVKALEHRLGYPVLVPPEPVLTGAIGAALLGRELAEEADKKGEQLIRGERNL